MKNKLVLFVDDEPNVLKALQRVLRDAPYQIITANSGAEALEKIATTLPDLVITDFRMANMNGIELVHEIHKRHPNMKCAILSGYADGNTVQEALKDGHILRFLIKPIDNDILKSTINELLGISG